MEFKEHSFLLIVSRIDEIEVYNQEASPLIRILSRYNQSMDLLSRVKTEKRLLYTTA